MIAPEQRPGAIRARLERAFAPSRLDIIDDSHRHAGHASAGGAGHFSVHIVSEQFAGKSPVQRHRLVYDALGDLMPEHIHALSIRAHTPAEQATQGEINR